MGGIPYGRHIPRDESLATDVFVCGLRDKIKVIGRKQQNKQKLIDESTNT